jgi:hypothetical protein
MIDTIEDGDRVFSEQVWPGFASAVLLPFRLKGRSKVLLISRTGWYPLPELDEDISVEGLLAGARSGESATSLNAWRARRRNSSRRRRKRGGSGRDDRLKAKAKTRAKSPATTSG